MKTRCAFVGLLAACVWAGVASVGQGALVVDWGGNYVSSTQPFANKDTSARQAGGFDGSGNPIQLSPTSGYSGTSSLFYGITKNDYVNPWAGGAVVNNTTDDRIEMKGPDSGDNSAYLLLWKQADFLNGLNTGNVGFDSTTTVFVDLATLTSFNAGRLVLRQGSSYYVSAAVFNSTTANETQTPTSLTWYNYSPGNTLSSVTTIGSVAGIVSGGQIANVTEIGFLFTSNNSGTDAARVQNFEVNMIVIPEPATLAVLGLGVVGVVLRRRRA